MTAILGEQETIGDHHVRGGRQGLQAGQDQLVPSQRVFGERGSQPQTVQPLKVLQGMLKAALDAFTCEPRRQGRFQLLPVKEVGQLAHRPFDQRGVNFAVLRNAHPFKTAGGLKALGKEVAVNQQLLRIVGLQLEIDDDLTGIGECRQQLLGVIDHRIGGRQHLGDISVDLDALQGHDQQQGGQRKRSSQQPDVDLNGGGRP